MNDYPPIKQKYHVRSSVIDKMHKLMGKLIEQNRNYKCLFFRSEIKYRGFLIDNEGVKADLSKLTSAAKYSQASEFSRFGWLVSALYTKFCDRSRAPFPIFEESAAL